MLTSTKGRTPPALLVDGGMGGNSPEITLNQHDPSDGSDSPGRCCPGGSANRQPCKASCSTPVTARLAGATVEVVNGASAGLKVTTGADGSYAIRARSTPARSFRRRRLAWETGLRSMAAFCQPCNPNFWVTSILGLPERRPTSRTTTVTVADPSCTSLPKGTRVANLDDEKSLTGPNRTSANTLFAATIDGSYLVSELPWQGVVCRRRRLHGGHDGRPAWTAGDSRANRSECLLQRRRSGLSHPGSSGVSRIAAAFEERSSSAKLRPGVPPVDAGGRFDCSPARAVSRVACQARNHQIVFDPPVSNICAFGRSNSAQPLRLQDRGDSRTFGISPISSWHVTSSLVRQRTMLGWRISSWWQ